MWAELKERLKLGYDFEEIGGIPLLDIDRQADKLDLPLRITGYGKAPQTELGTQLNIDTERASQLLHGYDRGITYEAVTASEYNIDLSDIVPDHIAWSHIYVKRWMARYWQSKGVRLLVDVSAGQRHFDKNLAGVPQGWKAFVHFVEGGSTFERVYEKFERVREYVDVTPSEMFWVIVGGSKSVIEEALKVGWVWLPRDYNYRKDKVVHTGSEFFTNRRERIDAG